MKKSFFIVISLSVLLAFAACNQYTPKPRGYPRIEPPAPYYSILPVADLPYSFHVSSLMEVELPPVGDPAGWINLSYPFLQAKIYCSYFPVKPSTLETALEESRILLLRQAKNTQNIREKAFENPEANVYASLYLLDGESASPVQFTITDSVSNFFRGSLLYNTTINADSLAPLTNYIQTDIMEIIQSFTWKK